MSGDPTFKAVFGKQWDALPSVLKQHYANRPYTTDVGTVEGRLNVEMSPLMAFMRPLLRLTGSLVPYATKDAHHCAFSQ